MRIWDKEREKIYQDKRHLERATEQYWSVEASQKNAEMDLRKNLERICDTGEISGKHGIKKIMKKQVNKIPLLILRVN